MYVYVLQYFVARGIVGKRDGDGRSLDKDDSHSLCCVYWFPLLFLPNYGERQLKFGMYSDSVPALASQNTPRILICQNKPFICDHATTGQKENQLTSLQWSISAV